MVLSTQPGAAPPPVLRGAGWGEGHARAPFITIIFDVQPTLAWMSQNKRINSPTAYKASAQLEGRVGGHSLGVAPLPAGWGVGNLAGPSGVSLIEAINQASGGEPDKV